MQGGHSFAIAHRQGGTAGAAMCSLVEDCEGPCHDMHVCFHNPSSMEKLRETEFVTWSAMPWSTTGGKKKKCANNKRAAFVTGTSSHAGGCILCRLSHRLTRCSAIHSGPCTLKYTNHFPVGRKCEMYLHCKKILISELSVWHVQSPSKYTESAKDSQANG